MSIWWMHLGLLATLCHEQGGVQFLLVVTALSVVSAAACGGFVALDWSLSEDETPRETLCKLVPYALVTVTGILIPAIIATAVLIAIALAAAAASLQFLFAAAIGDEHWLDTPLWKAPKVAVDSWKAKRQERVDQRSLSLTALKPVLAETQEIEGEKDEHLVDVVLADQCCDSC